MVTNLTTDRQIDTHLKPIKSREELSSLELSTKGNGARISGDLEVTGEVKAGSFANNDFYHIMNSGFYATDANGDYIPLNGTLLEQTSTTNVNESVAFVVPFDCELEFVLVRSEAACNSSVVGLHISSADTEVPNTTAQDTVTVDMASDDTAYKFDFRLEDNKVGAGQIVAIKFDPTNTPYDTNVTIVWKFYGNKPLGDSQ